MSEEEKVLTQDEISALFEAVGSSPEAKDSKAERAVNSQPAQKSSLRRSASGPERSLFPLVRTQSLTKETEEALMLIYDSFSYKATSSLEAALQTPVQLRVESTDQILYGDFIQNLPEPSSMWYLNVDPSGEKIGICLEPALVHACVALLMGGRPQTGSVRESVTDLEQSVIRSVIEVLGREMEHAWSRFTPITTSVGLRETRPRFLQVFPRDKPLLLTVMKIEMAAIQSQVVWGIPTSLVQTLRPAPRSRSQAEKPAEDTEMPAIHLQDTALRLPTDVDARIEDTTIKVFDLLQLKEGDVLKLDHRVQDSLAVAINGQKKFSGMIVVADKRRAVEIVNRSAE